MAKQEPALHPATEKWFSAWSAEQTARGEAFSTQHEEKLTGSYQAQRPAQDASVFSDEIAANNSFAQLAKNFFEGMEKEGIRGFPDTASLEERYKEARNLASGGKVATQLLRQYNLLEAYRKKHLRDKQTKAARLKHAQVEGYNKTAMLQEISRSLLIDPLEPPKRK